MSVIRIVHNKENPFVQLNKKALWDQELSSAAVGLWARCMSRPDNWTFSISELATKFKEGKKCLYRLINELVAAGYAIKGQNRKRNDGTKKGGKRILFDSYNYIFFEFKLTPEEKSLYMSDFQKMFPLSVFGHVQKDPLLIAINKKDKERAISDKKGKPPSQASPSSSTKKYSDKIASLVRLALSLGLALEERDFAIWLAKYPLDRIQRNMELAVKRKPKELRRWLEMAIRGDYAQEMINLEINKAFFDKFAQENHLKFTLFKKHAMLQNGKELDFKLNISQFNENLMRYLIE